MAKKKKSRKWIILIVVLLVVAAAAFIYKTEIQKSIYPLKYENYITTYSEKYGLDAYLVAAVIYTESSFDEKAESSRGAIGLMQIMPETGEWLAKKLKLSDYSLYDVKTNIEMGCWYLSFLSDKFDGNTTNILAGYNAGHNRVSDWLESEQYSSDGKTLEVIPYAETEKYVSKVNKNYEIYKALYVL